MLNRNADRMDREKAMAEGIWLHYFNHYLLASGTITEKEYAQMSNRIAAYTSIHQKKK